MKAIIDTYTYLLGVQTSSMLAVQKELKQGELRVPAHYLAAKQ
jgi:hypothetical protein